MKHKISTDDAILQDGARLTEADFERMAREVETADIDIDRLQERALSRPGRPSLSDTGRSSVLQVRLDEATRQRLRQRAEADHTTPSKIARDAIQAWLNAS